MNTLKEKRLWFYPILFGFLGALIGLITRYLFSGFEIDLPITHFVHSHSHVMLLGFIFNALVILLWNRFTKGLDSISHKYFLGLQISVGGMLFAFIAQGYGLISIIFSTSHLWLSYIFLIRLWKKLNKNDCIAHLVKIGIVFHFISSIGPYCLGPLMVLEMHNSPLYQQAIFFYLHFQFFGVLFIWLVALWIKNTQLTISKPQTIGLCLGLIGLYAHSLDYSFNHWSISFIGAISSILLLVVFLSYIWSIRKQKSHRIFIYFLLLLIGLLNFLGSIPSIAEIVVEQHFVLIGWLHFLFLGLYVPYIWLESPMRIPNYLWILYGLFLAFSEFILVFPNISYQIFDMSIMWLLFIAYLGLFVCFSIIHLPYLIAKIDD